MKAAQQDAQRKQQLIAQGRVYRAETVLAKETVRAGLQPQALAANLLAQATAMAVSAFAGKHGGQAAGLNAAALLPLVLRGASALMKKGGRARGALAATVVAAAVALLAKRKAQAFAQEAERSGHSDRAA